MTDIYHFDGKKDAQTMISTDSGKRKKEQFIENLHEGDVLSDFFAVKLKNPPRPYKKGTWFDVVVTDKTGEIGIKYWGGDNKDRVKRLYESFNAGDIIQIRQGYVEVYEDRMQVSINETTGGIRRVSPSEYDVADFIPSLEEDKIQELYTSLQQYIKQIKHPELTAILKAFFSDKTFVHDFTHTPSAMTHHHNYIGGNLEHTIGVIRLSMNLAEMYPDINKELLMTGAILHDVGKIKEYKCTASIEKTDEGNFIGHIVIGDRWLRQVIADLRKQGTTISEEVEQHLAHILLSHHGKYEWGSPRMPKTVEAFIVHQADYMDSQIKYFMQTLETGRKASDDNWGFIYDSDMGRRRLIYLKNMEKQVPDTSYGEEN